MLQQDASYCICLLCTVVSASSVRTAVLARSELADLVHLKVLGQAAAPDPGAMPPPKFKLALDVPEESERAPCINIEASDGPAAAPGLCVSDWL